MLASDHYCLTAPSKEIRLLDLLPGTVTGMLSGRLRRVPIDKTPPFVSISHVWGQEKAEAFMHLESGCGNKDVPVSRNLESLLLSLLCHDSNTLPQLWDNGSMLPMWIDMACINQVDVSEKASQIPLMRHIYSQAKWVIIWINESDSRLLYAFHYLRRLLKDRPLVSEAQPWTMFDPIGWDALKRLLSCDWFHRRWVVQEAVIPRQAVFLCGSDTMTMDDLLHGVDIACSALIARPKDMKVLKTATIGSIRPILVMKDLKRAFHTKSSHPRLLWLLENLRLSETTIAHDQVYGLLALCNPEESMSNPIRYDLEPEEAFRTSIETHARLYNNLDFLGLCTPAQRDGIEVKGLHRTFRGPSWVPNWCSARLRRCLGLHGVNHKDIFNASGSMPVHFEFNGGELTVSGILIDRITTLGSFCNESRHAELSDPNSTLFQQYFDFWTKSATYGNNMPYPVTADRAEAIASTLSLFGVFLDPVPPPAIVPTMFYQWCKESRLGERLASLGLRSKLVEGCERSFVRMKRLLSWQPFTTEKGYIGLAREQCVAGDEIWVVAGCSVPLVLSSSSHDQGGKMEVKGEVFIDKIMFGETFAGSTESVLSPSIVTLI
ncbi:hypothetical protein JDV02_000353 [Purpureocillium takamizusanense]|uniref:Heterokaryon incompatibility domain-containing protein n=1 Tax=Purpureocillium takamizusanense TaxID=2060973 RepID=A0A9Q8Q4N2_9HYPO|nr:uncharacterized protein JDV02_000353 [Purpureocillium takamizusanense]UNI13628.1 hypothetical protein JDV02_000353 [Purpureocillium takamizusanense]